MPTEDRIYSIGEAAIDVGVATHVLRHWEANLSRVTPQRRGQRRLYSEEDLQLLRRIKVLVQDKGMHLSAVEEELRDDKVDNKKTLLRRLDKLIAELASLEETLKQPIE